MAHAKAVNRKKNWDDDDPEGAASGVNTPITGNIPFAYKRIQLPQANFSGEYYRSSVSHFIINVPDYTTLKKLHDL